MATTKKKATKKKATKKKASTKVRTRVRTKKASAKKTREAPAVVDESKDVAELTAEALRYGFALSPDLSLDACRREVEAILEDRRGKPMCYQRMFLSSDPRCRICDLREMCSGATSLEDADVAVVACSECGTGSLTVELVDEATGDVVDYGCTSDSCAGTLSQQTGVPMRPPTIEEIDRGIMDALAKADGPLFLRDFQQLVPGGILRVKARVAFLRHEGTLRYGRRGFEAIADDEEEDEEEET